jgi:predicted transcriptional regulator
LAHEAGYASEPHVTIEELANELGLGYTVTTARCSELRREGLLLSIERGAYRVLLRQAIEKVLAELSQEQV